MRPALVVCCRDVDEEIHGQHHGGNNGACCGHGYRESEVRIEQRTPEIRVAASRGRRNDEQCYTVDFLQAEGDNRKKATEGEQNELTNEPDKYGFPIT